jgi:hypothetical protein
MKQKQKKIQVYKNVKYSVLLTSMFPIGILWGCLHCLPKHGIGKQNHFQLILNCRENLVQLFLQFGALISQMQLQV